MSCRLLKTDNCKPAARISNGGYSHAVVTQTVKEYLACSWQLTADSFYLLTAFLTTGTDPSHSLRMTINVSLHYDSFSSNRHSERTQECLAKKTGNGMVTRSEESITRMASYRFPRYASRSFTFASDGVLPFPVNKALYRVCYNRYI